MEQHALVAEPVRYFLDAMAFDAIADEVDGLAVASEAVRSGSAVLLTSEVVLEELTRVPDEQRRLLLLSVPHVTVTPYARWGISRWGEANWGDGDALASVDSAQGTHGTDAHHAALARDNDAVLVTADRRLQNRARAGLGIEVVTPSALLEVLRGLSSRTGE